MQLSLSDDEAKLLRRLLTQWVSEVKSEVANTERYEWRQDMKRDGATVKAIVERLGPA